ncbi:hypothetical protein IQ268_19645 [Oculatella sp. LEGE 06141]|uniref:hypothetical protein n=1 Tax=Oculatella sp. LEGE 06141 TaxID=1828648 RepID=UPI0018830B15|nr:hypothetical protein [Oculatella sp. LEGE 06141]MBE9180778.1 hypothetical protein [Oculatella sp. LEGE 06141]
MGSLGLKAIAFTPKLLIGSAVGCVVWAIGSTATLAAIPTIFMGDQSAVEPMLLTQLFKGSFSVGCLFQDCHHSSNHALLRSGAKVTTHYQGEEQVVQPGETHRLTLSLDQPIFDAAGKIILPASSQMEGNIISTEQGKRFVAHQVTTSGKTYLLVAEFALASGTQLSPPMRQNTVEMVDRETVIIVPNQVVELSLTSDFRL